MYVLTVECAIEFCTVMVNGVVVVELGRGQSTSLGIPEWIRDGVNQVSVAGQSPADAGARSEQGEVGVRIDRAGLAQQGQSPVFAERFRPTQIQEATFVLNNVRTPELWKASERLSALSPRDVSAIWKILDALRKALSTRNIDLALSLTMARVRDLSISLGTSVARMMQVYSQSLARAGQFSIELAPESDLVFSVEADGRLFWAKTRGGAAALRARNGPDFGDVNTGFMKSNGAWAVIR